LARRIVYSNGQGALMRRLVVLFAAIALALPAAAHATVFSWRDEAGALHFTNDEREVPPEKGDAVRSFTSKAAIATASAAAGDDSDGPADPAPAADSRAAYERGLEAGMRIAEEQVRTAAELARVMVEAERPQVPYVFPATAPAPAPPPVSVAIVRSPYRLADGYDDAWWPGGFWPGWSPWFVSGGFIDGRVGRHHRFRHGMHGGRDFGKRDFGGRGAQVRGYSFGGLHVP